MHPIEYISRHFRLATSRVEIDKLVVQEEVGLMADVGQVGPEAVCFAEGFVGYAEGDEGVVESLGIFWLGLVERVEFYCFHGCFKL